MVSESNKIGLLPAILMVAGNMMGSGVFMLPANLAGIGSIAIIYQNTDHGVQAANSGWCLPS